MYEVPAWDPNQQGLINSLEAVQKFAMRVCTKQWSSNYNALFNAYGAPSLRKRRLILKLSYLYNILNGPTHSPNHFQSKLELLVTSQDHTDIL